MEIQHTVAISAVQNEQAKIQTKEEVEFIEASNQIKIILKFGRRNSIKLIIVVAIDCQSLVKKEFKKEIRIIKQDVLKDQG